MQFREEKRCPSCGHLPEVEEKIRYGGRNDCRSGPFLLCPACGRNGAAGRKKSPRKDSRR